MERICYIYGLVDPRTDEVRYVGKTMHKERRLHDHIRDCAKRKTYKDNWLLELSSFGMKPEMIVLCEATESDWQDKERFHIKELFGKGCNLTNLSDGGEGCYGPEISKRISKAMKGMVFSKERNSKISDALKGHVISDETAKKIGIANKGRIWTAEQIERQNAPKRGVSFTQEHKDKMSASMKGKKKSKPPWNKGLKMEFKPRPRLTLQMEY
jgi:hypothetical protein